MVPGKGTESNSHDHFLTRNKAEDSADKSTIFEPVLSPETCTELFDILAQWNYYLENHVPEYNELEGPDL